MKILNSCQQILNFVIFFLATSGAVIMAIIETMVRGRNPPNTQLVQQAPPPQQQYTYNPSVNYGGSLNGGLSGGFPPMQSSASF